MHKMGSEAEEQQLHILFFPLMAHGHALPMFDLANLFASRGVRSTLVLTPSNAALFHADAGAGHPANVHVRLLHIPAAAFAAVGLPDGTEHGDSLTTQQHVQSFFLLLNHLEPPLRRLAGELRPDCIVSDMFFPWTVDVARDLGVPRLVFTGSSYLCTCVNHALLISSPENHVVPDDEPFAVPGLPDRIEFTKSQLPDFQVNQEFKELWKRIIESEKETYGAVMNSFYELEHAFIDHTNTILGRKTWPVGPLSLLNSDKISKFNRGKKAAIEVDECLSWLDSKQPGSVLYICFGSMCSFGSAQYEEIAAALETNGCNFVWVVKPRELLPHGFEERVGEKGLVIRGWAPQVLILNHEAIAAFVTHCGWNSTLEGLMAGVPMVTWPVFADQFYNEKLVSRVLRIGVEVGARRWVASWAEEEEEGRDVMGRAAVEAAVAAVMGDGEEGEGMRRRAKELAEMGRKAMEEGGSSYVSLGNLIEELREISSHNKKSSNVNHILDDNL